MEIPYLFMHSSGDGHLGCFHFGAIIDNAALNICVQAFAWIYSFHSLGYALFFSALPGIPHLILANSLASFSTQQGSSSFSDFPSSLMSCLSCGLP